MKPDPLFNFQSRALAIMTETLVKMNVEVVLPIEEPPEGMGDFAFPCFSLAKELKKAPEAIATEIVELIDKDETFSKVEANGPYVNFHIDPKELANITVKGILGAREEYGDHEENSQSILLEHTSANPNGPLHVGRARNPIIGDTLARILKRCGYDVINEYYVDDMGKQQVTLTWGVDNLKNETEVEKPDHKMVWFYQEASKRLETDAEVKDEIERMLADYEEGDVDIASRVRSNCQTVMDGILKSLRRLDIFFDSLAWESKYVLEGDVKRVIESLKVLDCTDYDGQALYLDLSHFGVKDQETKFYLTRSDGSSLYSTRDVAYHLDKLARSDIAINVLGEDHKLKAKAVGICLELLGSERIPDVVFYSFVSLPEGKMSTRHGRVVYLDDLIEEAVARARKEVDSRRPELAEELRSGISEAVGIGAIRYNIIRVQAEKPIVFKWEDALNFEGNSGPFVQYSHAWPGSHHW